MPERFGGAGGTVRDVIRFVIDVAAVDSSVAQSLRPGFGVIESLLWANNVDVFARAGCHACRPAACGTSC